MTLTDEQTAVVLCPTSVSVTASAGTGKTTLLAERYLHHLEADDCGPLAVVAVTFTERAAGELRARIVALLRQRQPARTYWQAEVAAAPIGTLHSLCASIARSHPLQAGVAPAFRVADAGQADLLYTSWLDDVLATADQQCFGPPQGLTLTQAREALWAMRTDPAAALASLDDCLAPANLDRLRAEAGDFAQRLKADPELKEAIGVLRGPLRTDAQRAFAQAYLDAWDLLEQQPRASLDLIADTNTGNATRAKVDVAVKRAFTTLHKRADLERNTPPYDDAVDGPHLAQLRLLKGLFVHARQAFDDRKRLAGVLDFGDLEQAALRALSQPEVQAYWRERWRAVLVDEAQDLNPAQGQLLTALVEAIPELKLTLVGDRKQSIYRFRRARPQVLAELAKRLVAERGGCSDAQLTGNFRTHDALVNLQNRLFDRLFDGEPQCQASHRGEEGLWPRCLWHGVAMPDGDLSAAAAALKEAQHLVGLIQDWQAGGQQVGDGRGGKRPMKWGDVAILGRSWKQLEVYADTLTSAGIPSLMTGGGNLLATREAKDAWALLRYLARPSDSLSLAAVLRSPYFALSDVELLKLKGDDWQLADRPAAVLKELRDAVCSSLPSRLLERADSLTGYSAVIANLPPGPRRLADYEGFVAWVRSQEGLSGDCFGLVRTLRAMAKQGVSIDRPNLAAADAVQLISIHSAKGLEWPVVIVPNWGRSSAVDQAEFRFEPGVGAALAQRDADNKCVKTQLLSLLQKHAEDEATQETKRLAYVALTRARDHLVISSTKPTGGNQSIQLALQESFLTVLDLPEVQAAYRGDEQPPALSRWPAQKPVVEPPSKSPLLGAVALTPFEVPVTSLAEYEACPRRFWFRIVAGFPSQVASFEACSEDEERLPRHCASIIGDMTHRVLQLGLTNASQLPDSVQLVDREEAICLAEAFRTDLAFRDVRSDEDLLEHPVCLTVQGLRLVGQADRVGKDYVLDYKTGRHVVPDRHGMQLCIYAKALGKDIAYIADLRTKCLTRFERAQLSDFEKRLDRVTSAIVSGQYTATPETVKCGLCPFRAFCQDSAASDTSASVPPDLLD